MGDLPRGTPRPNVCALWLWFLTMTNTLAVHGVPGLCTPNHTNTRFRDPRALHRSCLHLQCINSSQLQRPVIMAK